MMHLLDAVTLLASLDPEATIYAAEPWSAQSRALIVRNSADAGIPPEAAALGLSCFIEVFIASEFLEGWSTNLGATPTAEARCARLIQYAITDA